jgi:hypothetical protein
MMMSVKQSVEWEWAGETEVLGENLPQRYLSTTNPKWPDLESNPGRRGGKPATNRLSYGIVNTVLWIEFSFKKITTLRIGISPEWS